MKIPESAASKPVGLPDKGDAYIQNPHYGKEHLTIFEAIDAINMLSGMIMSDLRFRGGDGNQRRTG